MFKQLEKNEKMLEYFIGKLIVEKGLIKHGDSILIGLSGGKDSWTLAYFLKKFQAKASIKFEVALASIDVLLQPKQKEILKKGATQLGLDFFLINNNIEQIISAKRHPGTSYCSLCRKLRQAYLYRAAQDLGYNKIAFGHHFDDFVESYMTNILYHGRTKSLPAIVTAQNGLGQLIRPMLYCPQKVIARFAKLKKMPIITCHCKGSNQPDPKKIAIHKLLNNLERNNPGAKRSIFAAAKNIVTDHVF